MSARERFVSAIQNQLQEYSSDLLVDLESFVRQKIFQESRYQLTHLFLILDEYFFGDPLSILPHVVSLDKSKETLTEAQKLRDFEFIPHVPELLPVGDNNLFETLANEGVGTIELGAEIIIEWFHSCWKKGNFSDKITANHMDCMIFIALHDTNEVYDLINSEWIPIPL